MVDLGSYSGRCAHALAAALSLGTPAWAVADEPSTHAATTGSGETTPWVVPWAAKPKTVVPENLILAQTGMSSGELGARDGGVVAQQAAGIERGARDACEATRRRTAMTPEGAAADRSAMTCPHRWYHFLR